MNVTYAFAVDGLDLEQRAAFDKALRPAEALVAPRGGGPARPSQEDRDQAQTLMRAFALNHQQQPGGGRRG